MIRFEYSILQTFLLVASIFVLTKAMIPATPLPLILRRVRDRLLESSYLLCLFVAFVASLIDFLETRFDSRITHAIHKDFTPLVARVGSHWVENLQHFRNLPLTYVLTYAYIWLFPAVTFALFFAFVYYDREELAQFLTATYFTNLLVELPFYLFFPVNEVWASDSHVRLLTDRINPIIMEHFRTVSAVDNCFPSFHTSLALLVAIAAWRSRDLRMIVISTLSAVLVVASTLYLGIHWPLDVVSGVLAAAICATACMNASAVFARLEFVLNELRQFAVDKISI
ncbi:MAG: phosphatase PAP2 family protein [Acidobacteriia bacterium]|nr:phosphatase PAP2 family protein [Terriglobia bacterium]